MKIATPRFVVDKQREQLFKAQTMFSFSRTHSFVCLYVFVKKNIYRGEEEEAGRRS